MPVISAGSANCLLRMPGAACVRAKSVPYAQPFHKYGRGAMGNGAQLQWLAFRAMWEAAGVPLLRSGDTAYRAPELGGSPLESCAFAQFTQLATFDLAAKFG